MELSGYKLKICYCQAGGNTSNSTSNRIIASIPVMTQNQAFRVLSRDDKWKISVRWLG